MATLKIESDRLQYPVSMVKGNKPAIVRICQLRDVLNMIVKDDKIKEHTEAIRNSSGKKQKDLKEKTEAFILGEFKEKREDHNLVRYTPIMAFDIDKIEHSQHFYDIMDGLRECEFTFAAFPSVRGKGLRFLVCHDASQQDHREAYLQIANHYSEFLNIPLSTETTECVNIDTNCQNPSRHWFIGHASIKEIHHNEDSRIYQFVKEEKTNAPRGTDGSSPDTLKYEDKIHLIKLIIEEQCPFRSGYRQKHIYSLAKLMYQNQITMSDAIDECMAFKEEDFDDREIRETVIRTYKRLKRRDTKQYSDSQLIGLCKHLEFTLPESQNKITQITASYPDINAQDNAKPTKFDLALRFLEANYSLEHNDVTRFVEDKGDRLTNLDMNTIYVRIKMKRLRIGKEDCFSLINSRMIPSYNPFQRFVEKNAHFSSNGHIKKLCRTIHTTTGVGLHPNFVEIYVSAWLVGMCASAFGPYVNPLLLVFCGGQNTGKTEWFRRLLPADLKPYMAESKLDHDKDSELLMTNKLMILDDEYGGKSKRDAKRLKDLISKDYFTVRAPYARTAERLRRISTLCGTSNEYDVLSDITGNRRVIPLNIVDIDKPMYNQIDKTALFMEAYRTFLSWEDKREWELDADKIKLLNDATTDFEEVRVEKEMILKYFMLPNESNKSSQQFFQTSEIAEIISRHNNLRISVRRIGAELTGMGLKRQSGKGDSRRMKGYYLVKKSNVQTDKPGF